MDSDDRRTSAGHPAPEDVLAGQVPSYYADQATARMGRLGRDVNDVLACLELFQSGVDGDALEWARRAHRRVGTLKETLVMADNEISRAGKLVS